ncbi:unnamed protein product [Phytomonas sp. Hart1]|nr:unnamed protein product [Phytomonas sp. Hart1]|eukprot:CCW67341.1 unnamed protein product [Phytomonas sp. isolate Hart1]
MFKNQRYEWIKNFTNGDLYSGEAIPDNVKDGQGTYYWASTGSTYKGAWSKDQPHGQGTMTIPGAEGYTYIGNFTCGKHCGQGECRFNNDRVYIGEWLDDQMHGQGTLRGGAEDSFKEYKGPFSKGLRSGKKGQCLYTNGDHYVGEWIDDMRHGMGELTLAPEEKGKKILNKFISSHKGSTLLSSGSGFTGYIRPMPPSTTVASVVHYKGHFKCDIPSCITGGSLMYDDGSTYVGAVDGHLRRSGEGQHNMVNGDVYSGHFCEDERDGHGVLRCAADELSYDGIWLHGELDGFVVYHRSFLASQPNLSTASGNGDTCPQTSLKPLTIVDYEGPCARGEFTGSDAVITFFDHSMYRGDVYDGQPNGCGVLENRLVCGSFPPAAFGSEVMFLRYSGYFSKGEPDGSGTATLRIPSSDVPLGIKNDSEATLFHHEGLTLVSPREEGLILQFKQSGTFRGSWSRGLPEGSGEWNWESKSKVYQGEVHLGLPNGQGIYKSISEQYEGHFEEGLPSGYGIYRNILTHVTFQGNWLAGLYHGLGNWTLTSSGAGGDSSFVPIDATYKGSWQNGKKHGHGIECNAEEIYEGEFVDGMRHGHGILRHISDDGYCYEGDFSQGKLSGISGKLTFPNGAIVTGSFEDGVPHGDNICAVFPLTLTFKGRYDHGCPIGIGDITYANGDRYSGEVELATSVSCHQEWAPQRHGKGVYTFVEGNRLECMWRHNILNGHGKHITPNGEVSERHYADGIILSKSTSNTNMFTPGNEFPNTQSERMLKAKLESMNQPHKFIRRGEARQAVKSAVLAVSGNVSFAAKEYSVADTVPKSNATSASAKKEVSDITASKGPRRPRHNVTTPTSIPISTCMNHNPTSLFTGVMEKRAMSMEEPRRPFSQSAKTTSASILPLRKGSEKVSDTGAIGDPAHPPKRSTHRMATSKVVKDANSPPVVSGRKATSQESPPLSFLPQRLSSGTSTNYTAKRSSSLRVFQKLIKQLNVSSGDSPAEEDGSAVVQEADGLSLGSATRSDCNGGGVIVNGISDLTSQPNSSVAPDAPPESNLGILMREACEIRSTAEDEVYTLTEKVRTLNEKIWQLRFLLSSKPAAATQMRDGTEKLRADDDTSDTNWEPLEAMQRERREIVEALRSKLNEEFVRDS